MFVQKTFSSDTARGEKSLRLTLEGDDYMEFFPKAIPEGGRCFASFSHWTKFKQLQTLVELGEQRVTVEFDINLRDW